MLAAILLAAFQNGTAQQPSPSVLLYTERVDDSAEVLIHDSEWKELSQVLPNDPDLQVKNGMISGITWGAVPARLVVRFDGEHADVLVNSRRPTIRISGVSVSMKLLLVRLHPKRGYRDLVGSRLREPGAQIAKVDPHDRVAAVISEDGPDAWILRAKEALQPGEYAIMTGKQNLALFPFTILESPKNQGRR